MLNYGSGIIHCVVSGQERNERPGHPPGATVYYHRDQVSTRVTTDANGNVVSQQGHYPFGESWYQTGSATTDQQFTTYQRWR